MGTEYLTNAELAVMRQLWQTGRMTARQLREQLYSSSDRAQHGTVQRLLKNLESKGFVQRDRSLGVQLFEATVGRDAYGGMQLESLAEKLTEGSITPLLTHLLAEKKLSSAEIQRLRQLFSKGADHE